MSGILFGTLDAAATADVFGFYESDNTLNDK